VKGPILRVKEDTLKEATNHKYRIIVADNFHYMDESEHYTLGEFNTLETAIAACRKIGRTLSASGWPRHTHYSAAMDSAAATTGAMGTPIAGIGPVGTISRATRRPTRRLPTRHQPTLPRERLTCRQNRPAGPAGGHGALS
jgi:hypothetical protein